MTLIYDILNAINKTSFSYKGIQVNILGIPKFKKKSPQSMYSMIHYIKKNGLITENNNTWCLTTAGKKYIQRKQDSLRQFEHNFTKEMPKNLIIMFDVPETRKAEREWLRWHLKKFNYQMIQKSVWVGPSPLPKEFMDYILKIKLKDSIKTFKLAKAYKS
jgi:CRISPR-associated endonuclease Cas2